jgi:hypothetical protein
MGAPHSGKQSNWILTFLSSIWIRTRATSRFNLNIPKIEQYKEGEAEHTWRLELDSTEEVRINATLQSGRYLQGLRRHYNKSTKQRSVQGGDLVLRRIQKTDERHKLLNPWESPFIVAKVFGPGTYKLMTEDGEEVRNTWHISQLRRFYAWKTQDKIYVTIKRYVIRIHSQWNKDDISRQHLSYYDRSWVVFTTGWEQKSWKDAWSRNPKSFQTWMRVRQISWHSNLS